jgi:hypothetical protein
MIQASARKPKAGANILGFKVRQFLKNFLGSQTIRQKIQHITNTDPQAANTRAPAALF